MTNDEKLKILLSGKPVIMHTSVESDDDHVWQVVGDEIWQFFQDGVVYNMGKNRPGYKESTGMGIYRLV